MIAHRPKAPYGWDGIEVRLFLRRKATCTRWPAVIDKRRQSRLPRWAETQDWASTSTAETGGG